MLIELQILGAELLGTWHAASAQLQSCLIYGGYDKPDNKEGWSEKPF